MKRAIVSLVSLLPLTFAACGGGTDSGDCTASGGSNKAQYVVNTVMVPMQKTDYSIDLNGDGRVDNQLGQIIGTLATQGLNVQDGVTQSVANGQLVLLIGESSTDSTFQSDSCATSTLQIGKAVASMMPDFSGHGSFSADSTQPMASFNGPITAGKFNSAPPATTTHPVTAQVELPLVAGQPAINVTLQGAHIQFTRKSDGTITGGQVHGGIKNQDVQGQIVPGVAALLTNKLQHDMPQTSTDMQIASLFDTGGKADPSCSTGGCKNPNGTCATAKDNIIDICEVSTNGLVQNLLAPDVQLFDASGAYHPNPANTMKDSMSVGLGFGAVGATF
jgi:hypothetical protein